MMDETKLHAEGLHLPVAHHLDCGGSALPERTSSDAWAYRCTACKTFGPLGNTVEAARALWWHRNQRTELFKLVGPDTIEQLRSLDKPRPRMCLHDSHNDPVQMMTYIQRSGEGLPIHRNRRPLLKILLAGRSVLQTYDDQGNVIERVEMSPAPGVCAYFLPRMVWHTNETIGDEAILIEVLPGPYPSNDVSYLHEQSVA